MPYPPKPHQEHKPENIGNLIHAYPFAHLFSTNDNGHQVTRLPFAADIKSGKVTKLRTHMNASNPQCENLNNANVLVAFSGPDAYVSPNWRNNKKRGPTWDYTAVHIWGKVTLRNDRRFFETLVNDLTAPVEERLSYVSDYDAWTMADAPDEYVNRLLPHLTAFEIKVKKVQAISKLHQDFPIEDAISVTNHLNRAQEENSRKIASMIEARARARR